MDGLTSRRFSPPTDSVALVGELEPGLEATTEFEVAGQLLTDVGGTLGYSVLSTPAMIGMMEWTASKAIHRQLDEGTATVGFEVCVKHVGGAPEGSSCVARARLDEVIDGRKLRFSVDVDTDDGRKIGTGTHERRVVSAGPQP
jgi:fluoroacetyl-CoA thioesterase